MDALASLGDEIARGYTGWAIVLAILTVAEILLPTEPQPLGSRLKGIGYWALLVPAFAIMAELWRVLWIVTGLQPVITVPADRLLSLAGPAAPVLAMLIAAVFHDFFFYWFHRAQHRFLWRFHAVHHSIERMNAVNSYHHLSEALMQTALLTLPTSLLVLEVGATLPFAGLLLWLHIVYLHSPMRVSFGPLRAVFADNRFHRIHHSLEPQHFDRNFGAFTTLWDRLFGTAHFPRSGEWPAIGLAEIRQPESVAQWLDLPSRYRAAAHPVDPTIGLPGDRALAD